MRDIYSGRSPAAAASSARTPSPTRNGSGERPLIFRTPLRARRAAARAAREPVEQRDAELVEPRERERRFRPGPLDAENAEIGGVGDRLLEQRRQPGAVLPGQH